LPALGWQRIRDFRGGTQEALMRSVVHPAAPVTNARCARDASVAAVPGRVLRVLTATGPQGSRMPFCGGRPQFAS